MEETTVRVGEKAPNFTADGFNALTNDFGTYSLSDCGGKWVLLFFYPGDFTYVCPTELTALASFKNELEKSGVQVFVVSTDSKFSHKEWNASELSKAVEGGYPFTMLSDSVGKIGKPYGIYDGEKGVELRGTVVINPKGIVQWVSINVAALGRNPAEIVRCIDALKEHETSGHVMPACWIPGDESIDPTFDNSGNMWTTYKEMLKPKATDWVFRK
jgi:peroxiredoxin (alkyl hydroperoxide reductase subunit C)